MARGTSLSTDRQQGTDLGDLQISLGADRIILDIKIEI